MTDFAPLPSWLSPSVCRELESLWSRRLRGPERITCGLPLLQIFSSFTEGVLQIGAITSFISVAKDSVPYFPSSFYKNDHLSPSLSSTLESKVVLLTLHGPLAGDLRGVSRLTTQTPDVFKQTSISLVVGPPVILVPQPTPMGLSRLVLVSGFLSRDLFRPYFFPSPQVVSLSHPYPFLLFFYSSVHSVYGSLLYQPSPTVTTTHLLSSSRQSPCPETTRESWLWLPLRLLASTSPCLACLRLHDVRLLFSTVANWWINM